MKASGQKERMKTVIGRGTLVDSLGERTKTLAIQQLPVKKAFCLHEEKRSPRQVPPTNHTNNMWYGAWRREWRRGGEKEEPWPWGVPVCLVLSTHPNSACYNITYVAISFAA